MDFSKVVSDRHSCRWFKTDPVNQELIKKIIEDGQKAPSWVNAQEHRVYVATGNTMDAIRKEFIERNKNHEKGDSDIPVSPRTDWSEMAQKNMFGLQTLVSSEKFRGGMAKGNDELFNAPAVIFLTLPADANKWAILDLGLFAENLMLSAEDNGLGSIIAYNLIKYPDALRSIMKIIDDEDIVIGIAVGYEAEAPINELRTSRLPVEAFTQFFD